VDVSTGQPFLYIPGELQKSAEDGLLPIMDDFAAFLLATPPDQRHGPVFSPMMPTGRASYDQAGRMVSVIGELARVIVHTNPKTGRVKYASAHDIRRAFGTRWARSGFVSLQELQLMMRHADSKTTQAYYVEMDARELVESIRRRMRREGTVLGTVAGSEENQRSEQATQVLTSKQVTK
jgi:integrase